MPQPGPTCKQEGELAGTNGVDRNIPRKAMGEHSSFLTAAYFLILILFRLMERTDEESGRHKFRFLKFKLNSIDLVGYA